MTAPYYVDELVTLYHGDCLELDAWVKADVLVTDPPYGMGYRSRVNQTVANDHNTDARDAALELWGVGRPALVFGTWRVQRPENVRQMLIWYKAANGPGQGDTSIPWGLATEEIYVLGHGWEGRRRSNVISTTEHRGGTTGMVAALGHPTPKPVGLMEQLLQCAPQGVVADPFAGSGATLLAARNLGIPSVGVELEEAYCELIAGRLAQGTLL